MARALSSLRAYYVCSIFGVGLCILALAVARLLMAPAMVCLGFALAMLTLSVVAIAITLLPTSEEADELSLATDARAAAVTLNLQLAIIPALLVFFHITRIPCDTLTMALLIMGIAMLLYGTLYCQLDRCDAPC